jgi:predicted metal-dependent peptidase
VTTRDLEKLQAARVWAVNSQPYLAIALHSLQIRWVDGYGTFGVDRWWRMYVDPARVDEWDVPAIGGVLLHEVWHLLRDHHARAESIGVGHDRLRWNLAADAEINDDLVGAGIPLPGEPVLPRDLQCADGLLAEQYYRASLDRVIEVDCGSGADAHEREHEDGAPCDESPGLEPAQGEMVRVTCAREIQDAARTRGDVPASWQRWAEGRLTPKVDWRTVLAAQVRRALLTASGAVDYSWARPSRRPTPGVLLPSLRRPVPTIAVVVDTSGSVDDEQLAQALAEVDGALVAAGSRQRDVTVLSCDSAIAARQRVRSATQVRLAGGGGTDMRVGIRAALACRPRPDAVIVLTDGDTPWPAERLRGTVLVVGLLRPTCHPVPDWARVVQCHD